MFAECVNTSVNHGDGDFAECTTEKHSAKFLKFAECQAQNTQQSL